MELSGTHEGASPTSHWRVERAETLRPAPPDEVVEDVLLVRAGRKDQELLRRLFDEPSQSDALLERATAAALDDVRAWVVR